MSQTINLKEIERKAWTSVFRDGLWDVYLGMLMLSSAVGQLLSDNGAQDAVRIPSYLSVMVLGGIILWAGKKYVTAPRMGRAKFGPKRKAKINTVNVTVMVAVVLSWGLYLATVLVRNKPDWWPAIPFSAIIVVSFLALFSLAAYFLDYRRLYLIGVLFAFPEFTYLLNGFMGIRPGFVVYLVPAVIVLAVGLFVFVRFWREYPAPVKEALNDTP